MKASQLDNGSVWKTVECGTVTALTTDLYVHDGVLKTR